MTGLNRLMRPLLFSNDRDFLLSDLTIGLKMGTLKLSPLHIQDFAFPALRTALPRIRCVKAVETGADPLEPSSGPKSKERG